MLELLTRRQLAELSRERLMRDGVRAGDMSRKLGFRTAAGLERAISGRWLIPLDCAASIAEYVGLEPRVVTCSILWHRLSMSRENFENFLDPILTFGDRTEFEDVNLGAMGYAIASSFEMQRSICVSVFSCLDLWLEIWSRQTVCSYA